MCIKFVNVVEYTPNRVVNGISEGWMGGKWVHFPFHSSEIKNILLYLEMAIKIICVVGWVHTKRLSTV